MCMCCAFRSLVGALLKGGASALWVVAHLVVLCHMHCLQHQIWGSNLKEKSRIFGCLVGGGEQGKERRADMVKPSPDVQDTAPGGWHILKIKGLGLKNKLDHEVRVDREFGI